MTNCDVRTVCVELQRPGPPHNRLLSPLTRYLASTTDAEVGEVSVADEHAQMVRKLRHLRSTIDATDVAGHEERLLALQQLSRDMSRFFASVPGLLGQLTTRSCANHLIHLQIVTSASELAMLPFELAGTIESAGESPSGSLLLGGRPRVSLTRRVRSVTEGCVRWPLEPKILFVAASPRRSIPFDGHLESLLRALGPWVPPIDGASGIHEEGRKAHTKAVELQLKVLPDATIEAVARACAEEDFTHVHILAHGAPNPRSAGRQFGMELHGANPGEPHIVSGEQFATALRRDGGGSGPSIVTVAACDGGHVAEVMHTGASFLYDLHRSGIPVVIGSQFPLSKEGSGDLCERLYRGFLSGEDPRSSIADLRLRLHSRYAERNHDWASLVAYAVFPSDLEDKLKELRFRQGRRALNVAIDYMDREVEIFLNKPPAGDVDVAPSARHDPGPPTPARLKETKLVMERLVERVREAATLVPKTGPFRIDGLGLIGAHKKRLARALFRARDYESSFECLEDCQRDYASAFDEGIRYDDGDEATVMAPLHWALTQQVSVGLVLGQLDQPDLRATARTIALADVNMGRGAAEVWSITTLLELDLIAAWLETDKRALAITAILSWTNRLLQSRQNADAVYSTRRQLLRYVEWWWDKEFARELQSRRGRAIHAVSDDVTRVVWQTTGEMGEYLRVNPSSVARKR